MIIVAHGRKPIQNERFSFFVRNSTPANRAVCEVWQDGQRVATAKVIIAGEYDEWTLCKGRIVKIADLEPSQA